MAKKAASTNNSKSTNKATPRKKSIEGKTPTTRRLSVDDVPEPPDPPKAVLSISNSTSRDTAIAVHRDAWTLFTCIDIWEEWYKELEQSDDANPVVASRLYEGCSAAIFGLTWHGAFTPTFRNVHADDIVALLPKVPIRKGWQQDHEFRYKLRASLNGIAGLQGECSTILSQLKIDPLASFIEEVPEAVELVPQNTQEVESAAERIPPEFRSKPRSKDQLACFHSGERKSNPAQYLKRKGISLEGNKNSKLWVADIRDFDEAVHDKLLN